MRRALGVLLVIAAMYIGACPATDLPEQGSSRFDVLIGSGPIPFPFARLRKKIEAQLESQAGLPPLKITLIPFSRSLQRDASAPDFFRFPRVVLAIDGESRAGIAPLKDRLFIGYNEKAAVLEIISYNESLGRFEFQVVRDYRAGGRPQLRYARRELCLACHQNAAPIFARPLWDETPANPVLAARLRAAHKDFYGVAISGTDAAYLIDASVARANLFAVWNTLWRASCGADAAGDACRRVWLLAALRLRLSDVFPSEAALQDISAIPDARWQHVWPKGLSVADANIPNRDPLSPTFAANTAPAAQTRTALAQPLAALSFIPAPLEPLNPRPAMAVWQRLPRAQFLAGLAEMFSEDDIRRWDSVLRTLPATEIDLRLPCEFISKPQRVTFVCADQSARLNGNWNRDQAGVLENLSLAGTRAADSAIMEGKFPHYALRHHHLRLRLADGRAVQAIHFDRQGNRGQARLVLRDEFAALLPELERVTPRGDVFQAQALSQALFARLGVASPVQRITALPPPRLEEKSGSPPLSGVAAMFQQYCGLCHDSGERVPPNFLHGDAQRVQDNLKHCAPRIFYRLSMWQWPPAQRGKTPMPPIAGLAQQGLDQAHWVSSAALKALRGFAQTQVLQAGYTPAQVLHSRFEQLPACLPPA